MKITMTILFVVGPVMSMRQDNVTTSMLRVANDMNQYCRRSRCRPTPTIFEDDLIGFTLYDARKGTAIQPLGDYVKDSLPMYLNIRIEQKPSRKKQVEGVIVTFDNNSTLTRCERHLPYSAFGNPRSLFCDRYYGKVIEVGTHTITATAYPLSRCKGDPGLPLTQTFTVS